MNCKFFSKYLTWKLRFLSLLFTKRYNLMLECWNQNALKRPSFKEITVFLNSQLQKLSKTMSSISSFSSVNSNNELKKLNLDSNLDFKLPNKNKFLNDEADDEHNTSDVFFDETNCNQKPIMMMNKK